MQNESNSQIPLGLGMALAQNPDAMRRFASMSQAEQQDVVSRTHAVSSKQEMQAFVQSLTQNELT